jgi:type IV secretory pathway TrbD component
MERTRAAFTILLFGLGILAGVVGLVTDVYSAALGFVGLVALWVIGVTLFVFWAARDADEEFGSYRPRRLYDRY